MIALGTVFKGQGDKIEADALKILRSEFMRGKGNMTRNFAAIALGKIGGEVAFNALKTVAMKEQSQQGAYAALGLGILCEKLLEATDAKDEKAAIQRIQGLNVLRAAFVKCRNQSVKGGFAMAMGIARDKEAGPILLKGMKKAQTESLRGYIAIAIGMVNYSSATDYLRDVLVNADNLPLLKQQVAIGLGLMGNREVAGLLVKQMKEGNNAYVTTSISKALGFVGDRSTIQPLAEMMVDEKAQAITRAYATLALGTIGDDSPIPALSSFFFGYNYLASTQTLSLLQRIMNA